MTNRGLLPGAAALTGTGLTPAGLIQLQGATCAPAYAARAEALPTAGLCEPHARSTRSASRNKTSTPSTKGRYGVGTTVTTGFASALSEGQPAQLDLGEEAVPCLVVGFTGADVVLAPSADSRRMRSRPATRPTC